MELERLYPNSVKKRLESLVGGSVDDILKNPLQVALAIEQRIPGAAVQILSFTSEFIEPHLKGVGYKIIEFNNNAIVAKVPMLKKNLNVWSGELQSGTLVSCVEYSIRILMQRHLDPRACEVRIKESRVKRLAAMTEDATLSVQVTDDSREKFLLELFSKGKAHLEVEALVYNPKRQIVAQVSCAISVRATPRLGS